MKLYKTKKSNIHRFGLYAAVDIKKDKRIIQYRGKKITHKEAETNKKYGYEIVSLKEFNKLNPKAEVALVLVNSKLNNYHWLCFPVDKNIKEYFGPRTKVSKIYLLKKK